MGSREIDILGARIDYSFEDSRIVLTSYDRILIAEMLGRGFTEGELVFLKDGREMAGSWRVKKL